MSIDNVQDITPRVQYVATAGQTEFPYPFPIFDEDDLRVYVDGTLQTKTTDYTVSGVGEDTGGTVTFTSALSGDEVVTIYRETEIARTTDFQQNGPWRSTSTNDELDRITVILQELKAEIGRCLRFPKIATVASDAIELGPIANWLGRYVYINSSGQPEPAVISETTVTQSIIGSLLYPQTPAEVAANVTPANHIVDTTDYYKIERYFNGTISDGADITDAVTAALSLAKGAVLPAYEMKIGEIAVPAGTWIRGSYSKTVLRPANESVSKLLNITGAGYPTGMKLFVKLSDLFLYNGGVTTLCTGIHAEFFDQLDLEQVIVDGFYKNIELKNFSWAYLRRVRSWSAIAQNLRVDCDNTNDSNVHVNGWLNITESEFHGAQGNGPVADELYGAYIGNTATIYITRSQFHANVFGGLRIDQTYENPPVPREVGEVRISRCGFDSNGAVGLRLDTVRNFVVSQCWASSGRTGDGYSGIEIDNCGHGVLSENDCYNNGDCGIKIANSTSLGVFKNRCHANGQTGSRERAGIHLGSVVFSRVEGNNCIDEGYGRTSGQQFGILINGTSDTISVIGNDLHANATANLSLTGTNFRVRDNLGYVSENRGLASITAGNTSVTVTHGLSFTPAQKDIQVTAATGLDAATTFWVQNCTATTFDIACDAAPAVNIFFSWQASFS